MSVSFDFTHTLQLALPQLTPPPKPIRVLVLILPVFVYQDDVRAANGNVHMSNPSYTPSPQAPGTLSKLQSELIDKPYIVPIEVTPKKTSTSMSPSGNVLVADINAALFTRLERDFNINSASHSLHIVTIKEDAVDKYAGGTDYLNISSNTTSTSTSMINYGSVLVGAGGTVGAILCRRSTSANPNIDSPTSVTPAVICQVIHVMIVLYVSLCL